MAFRYGPGGVGRGLVLLLCFVVTVGVASPAVARGVADGRASSGQAVKGPQPTGTSGIDNMPRLGVEGLAVSLDPVLDGVTGAGVGFVRVQLDWSVVEPTNTTPEYYNWSRYDQIFGRLGARNLGVLVTVLGCPSWACVRDIGPLNDAAYGDFTEFMSALASRYSQAPYNVHYWELWNEPDGVAGPDNSWGWGMHPDKYAQALAAIYPAIKGIDPQSVIMSGGIAYDFWISQGGVFNKDFLAGVLDNGGGQYIDAVAFHYYTNNAHGWTHIGLKAAEVRSIMERHGVWLPLVCTEAGLTSSGLFGSNEQIQARYVVQLLARGAANGVRAQSWYLDRDYESPDPSQDVFASAGLMRLDNTLKPSHTALRVFAQEIGSGAFMRSLGPDDGVTGSLEGYRFRGAPGSQESVVWSNGGPGTLTIPATDAPGLVRAVSLSGEALATQPGPGGTVLLGVGVDPVYLEWRVPRFDDVPFDSWMYSYVEYLASRGVISGYSDGTFRPGNSATRGQFSKMLVLGMGWPITTTNGPHFLDVPESNPFYGHIETAFNQGIISGYACGGEGEPCPGNYFRAGNNVTRSQIAKMITLAKGWPLANPATATFIDVPVGSPFFNYVETTVAHAIVSGYSDNTFRPGNNATRAQLSKMLTLALQQP
ncbi:MAG: S-layer homology domain-containing protein [Chloroflexia bacterium]